MSVAFPLRRVLFRNSLGLQQLPRSYSCQTFRCDVSDETRGDTGDNIEDYDAADDEDIRWAS